MVNAGRTQRILQGLAAAVLILHGSSLSAQELIRISCDIPGDAKPIIVQADSITTWTEKGQRILLLKGLVNLEHGVLHGTMNQAVGWIDLVEFRKTSVMTLEIYGEGAVRLEKGAETCNGPRALLMVKTRGEIKLKAHKDRVQQQAQPGDILLQRGEQTRIAVRSNNDPGAVRQTGFEEPPQPPVRTDSPPLPVFPPPRPQAPIPPSTFEAPASNALPVVGTTSNFSPAAQTDSNVPGTGPPAQAFIPASPPAVNPSVQATPPPPGSLPSSGPVPGKPGSTAAPAVPPPPPPLRQFSIVPRTSGGFEPQSFQLENGEHVVIITGGVVLLVRTNDKSGLVDIEADRLVFWTKDNPQSLINNLRTSEGQSSRQMEFYLTGNVEMRSQNGPQYHTLRADEVYFDAGRNVAVARHADMEFNQRLVLEPVHLHADELLQLAPGHFKGYKAELFSSKLPSDPGLKVLVAECKIDEKDVPKTNLFGSPVINRQTNEPDIQHQRIFDGENVTFDFEKVPFFWLPWVRGDVNDPLGPVESLGVSYNKIFGYQFSATLNMYNLLGIDPIPDTRWRADVDYLSARGPAIGTSFDHSEKSFFGLPARVVGEVKAYGIYDTGEDQLGGGRIGENHTPWRGRFLWRENIQGLPEGFSIQAQFAELSDKNFLEQYYKLEFDQGYNQETFVYAKQQQDSWAWSVLAEPAIRSWVTETQWLPKADGYLLGESFFDIFTYNAHASAGYAQLKPTTVAPYSTDPTDAATSTVRADLMQELSAPFSLGPLRVAPYAVMDLAYYSHDLEGEERGRFYIGGGTRESMSFTRLFPDVQSELWNLNGINHKIVLSSNFFVAHSDTPHTLLPQLDRLNDDATDQAMRDILPLQPQLNPGYGQFLATLPMYDPQLYALRQLVDSRVDTLDTIEVLQTDIRQRWQTKRGYPGMEHVVDWMTLDLSASYFPHPTRDDFGHTFAFLAYDWNWNIGDRTALTSSGWMDPGPDGPRVFSIGAYLNRPDRTSYFLGYRQIDPLESRAITSAFTYVFSPKYAMTASSTWDFGVHTQINSVVFTRLGSDLQVSLGFTYNTILNTFGVNFMILPNIVPIANRLPPGSVVGVPTLGR